MVETLPELFLNTVNAFPKDGLFLAKKEGAYAPLSTRQFGDAVKDLCLGLHALGFRAGDKLCLLSENRPEWVMTDIATLCAGGLTVPVYTTLVTDQIGYIIDDSDAAIVVVSGAALWQRVEPLRDRLAKVRHYVMIDGPAPAGVVGLAELMEKGRALAAASPGLFGELASAVRPDDAASIIYTSGTTGLPKGVVLSHRNFLSNIKTVRAIIEFTERDVVPVLPPALPRPRADGHLHLPLRRLHGGLRRERRGRRREPPRGPAAHHGQRAAGLREDLRQGHGPGPRQPGPAPEDLLLGRPRRALLRRPQARRPARPGRPAGASRRRPQARLLQDHRPDGRACPLLRFGRGAALEGDRRVLLRPRPGRPRGLRADGDLARPRRQHLRGPQVRDGRQAHPRRRGPDRARTARSWPGARTS